MYCGSWQELVAQLNKALREGKSSVRALELYKEAQQKFESGQLPEAINACETGITTLGTHAS